MRGIYSYFPVLKEMRRCQGFDFCAKCVGKKKRKEKKEPSTTIPVDGCRGTMDFSSALKEGSDGFPWPFGMMMGGTDGQTQSHNPSFKGNVSESGIFQRLDAPPPQIFEFWMVWKPRKTELSKKQRFKNVSRTNVISWKLWMSLSTISR